MSVLVERTLDNARQLVASIQQLAQEHENVTCQLQHVQQELKEAHLQSHHNQSINQSNQLSRSASILRHIETKYVLSQDELNVGQSIVNQIRSIDLIPLKIFRIICGEITNQPVTERDILSSNSQQTKAVNDGRCLEVYSGLLMRAMSFHIVDCGGQRGDGGVDVKACLVDSPSDHHDVKHVYQPSDHVVLQCKQYRDTVVQASQIRELIGSMVLNQCSTGIMITTDRISEGSHATARQLAKHADDVLQSNTMSVFLWDASKLARYLGMFAADIFEYKDSIINKLRTTYRNVVRQVENDEPSFCLQHCLGQSGNNDLCENPRCQFHPAFQHINQMAVNPHQVQQISPIKSQKMASSFSDMPHSRHRAFYSDHSEQSDVEQQVYAMKKPRSPKRVQPPLSARRAVATPYRVQRSVKHMSPTSSRLKSTFEEKYSDTNNDTNQLHQPTQSPSSKSAGHSPTDRVSINLASMFDTPSPCKAESPIKEMRIQSHNRQGIERALKLAHRSLPSTPLRRPSNGQSQNDSPNVPALDLSDQPSSSSIRKMSHIEIGNNEHMDRNVQTERRINCERFLTVNALNSPKSAGLLNRTLNASLQIMTARISATRPSSPNHSAKNGSYTPQFHQFASSAHHLHIPAAISHASQPHSPTYYQSPPVRISPAQSTVTSQPFSPLSPSITERPPPLNPSFVAALMQQHRDTIRQEEANIEAIEMNNQLRVQNKYDEQADESDANLTESFHSAREFDSRQDDECARGSYDEQGDADDQPEGYASQAYDQDQADKENVDDQSDDEIPSFECSSDDEPAHQHAHHVARCSPPSIRRSRTRWTQQEEEALCAGVAKYHDSHQAGRGRRIWSLIRQDSLLGPILSRHAGDSDFKDKYRSLTQNVQN